MSRFFAGYDFQVLVMQFTFFRRFCTYAFKKFFDLNKQIEMAGDPEESQKLNGYSDVENGPINEANRECRDILCCGLFLAMLVAMVYMSAYGYANGNLTKPFRATDMNNIVCGDPDGVAVDYPYAYFFNPTTGDLSNRYCVKVCPKFAAPGILTTMDCYGTSCTYAVEIMADGLYTSSPSSSSDIIGYESSTLIDRVCVPSSAVFSRAFASHVATFSTYLSQGRFSTFITDLENNWQWVLVGFAISVVISFVFMYTLRCLAGLIVWVSCFGIILSFSLAGLICFYNAGLIITTDATSGWLSIPTVSGATETEYKVFGIISFCFAGVFLLLLICCFSRIRLAVAVCKAAGKFVAHTCMIVLVPIIQTAINISMWAICIVALLYLASAATYVTTGDVFTSVADYGETALVKFYVFLFGTLWCNAFIQAMGVFVLASACCIWYYSHGPDAEVNFPIFRSYKMVFRYHFGSLAFGSLILAIVQFLQIALQLFKKQAEASGADNSKCFEYVLNCMRCCLQCVERIVQFINKTAYIQIALRGKNFCNAAKDGFEIVWANPLRYTVVAGVGEVIMFLGKLMIAAGTTVIFYCMLTYVSSIKENVMEPIYLLILMFLISFAVGMLFMAVYSVAMDTIFQCFIVDEANQKVKGGKTAMYAPEEIQALIDVEDE